VATGVDDGRLIVGLTVGVTAEAELLPLKVFMISSNTLSSAAKSEDVPDDAK